MTKVKLCGLTGLQDIEAVNELAANGAVPDYIGFVFAQKSRRAVTPLEAEALKQRLTGGLRTVGVFVDEPPRTVAALLRSGVIDLAQLHGREDESYLAALRALTDKPLMQAFRIRTAADVARAERSSADFILLDSGAGTGTVFDWTVLQTLTRPYFLAGGLTPDNVGAALRRLHPFAVDVSSGIETDGKKDKRKMADFMTAVGKEETL